MGIFDFLKSSENKNKNKENSINTETKINNHQVNKEIPSNAANNNAMSESEYI